MDVPTKAQLVAMDEELIEVLAHLSHEDYPAKFQQRYLVLFDAGEDQYGVEPFDNIESLKKHIFEVESEDSGWHPAAVYDLQELKEIPFQLELFVWIGDEVKEDR